jgi:hypothetical protein
MDPYLLILLLYAHVLKHYIIKWLTKYLLYSTNTQQDAFLKEKVI